MTVWARTTNGIQLIDQNILRRASLLRGPLLDFVMRSLSRAGDWQSWAGIFLAGFISGGALRALVTSVFPRLCMTFIACRIIKSFSKRPRPSRSLVKFSTLLRDPDPYSFPSAHSACAWSVCVSSAIYWGGGWSVLLPYAALISYSRIHVGAHYPFDVLIGTGIGLAFALG